MEFLKVNAARALTSSLAHTAYCGLACKLINNNISAEAEQRRFYKILAKFLTNLSKHTRIGNGEKYRDRIWKLFLRGKGIS